MGKPRGRNERERVSQSFRSLDATHPSSLRWIGFSEDDDRGGRRAACELLNCSRYGCLYRDHCQRARRSRSTMCAKRFPTVPSLCFDIRITQQVKEITCKHLFDSAIYAVL